MRRKSISSIILAIAATLALLETPELAQNPDLTPNYSKMVYHNGPVIHFTPNVYLIWYGCWTDNCGTAGDTASFFILSDFVSTIGSSRYFQINSTYPDSIGQRPSGALFFGGGAFDPSYSHGFELTESDIQGIVADQIVSGGVPLDPSGFYIVIASADVGSKETGFCTPSALPHHGFFTAVGSTVKYGFVGNPNRCPTVGAPQFFAADGSRLPTPNGNLGADAMVSTIAHLLDVMVTDPLGGAWFDSYGLENADKCQGTFGRTYLTPNGARANMRLNVRDFLVQQNWVNVGRGYCSLSNP